MDDFRRTLKESLKDEAFREAWIDAGQEYRRQCKDLIREAVEESEAQIADGKGADARQGSLEKFRAVLAKVPETEPREEDRLP